MSMRTASPRMVIGLCALAAIDARAADVAPPDHDAAAATADAPATTTTPSATIPTPATPAATTGVAKPQPKMTETLKQRRTRERRKRWRALAGIFGDTLEPADTPHGGGQQGAGPAPEAAPLAAEAKEKGWKLKLPDVGGFIQVHFRQPFHTGADPLVDFNNFRVLRVRLKIDGEVFPWLGYVIELDPRSPEITGLMRDAYIKAQVFHQELRFGQQKTQFGYENDISSTELYVVNRAETSDNIARGYNLRDVGIGVVGHIPLPAGVRIDDAVTITNGNGMNTQLDDTGTKNVWGRLGVRYQNVDLGDLEVAAGGSGGTGDFFDTGELIAFRRVGVDAEIDQTWFFAAAEYQHAWDIVADSPEQSDGFTVIAAAKTPWAFGPLVRYDALTPDFERWTFGAYWGDPGDLLRVIVNYELRLLKDGMRGDDKLFLQAQAEF